MEAVDADDHPHSPTRLLTSTPRRPGYHIERIGDKRGERAQQHARQCSRQKPRRGQRASDGSNDVACDPDQFKAQNDQHARHCAGEARSEWACQPTHRSQQEQRTHLRQPLPSTPSSSISARLPNPNAGVTPDAEKSNKCGQRQVLQPSLTARLMKHPTNVDNGQARLAPNTIRANGRKQSTSPADDHPHQSISTLTLSLIRLPGPSATASKPDSTTPH